MLLLFILTLTFSSLVLFHKKNNASVARMTLTTKWWDFIVGDQAFKKNARPWKNAP